jgi:hypothetical protein
MGTEMFNTWVESIATKITTMKKTQTSTHLTIKMSTCLEEILLCRSKGTTPSNEKPTESSEHPTKSTAITDPSDCQTAPNSGACSFADVVPVKRRKIFTILAIGLCSGISTSSD